MRMLDECNIVAPVFPGLLTVASDIQRIVTFGPPGWIKWPPWFREHNNSFTIFNPRIWNYNCCHLTCRPMSRMETYWQVLLPTLQILTTCLPFQSLYLVLHLRLFNLRSSPITVESDYWKQRKLLKKNWHLSIAWLLSRMFRPYETSSSLKTTARIIIYPR